MKIKRDFVTPYLVFIFLVVACSGVLMFFHLLDDYTEVVHEFLGLTFVVFAILHVTTNWVNIKSYSAKRLFIVPSIAVLIFAVTLIVIGKIHGNLEHDLLERLVKSPVSNSFKVLNVDYGMAKTILEKNNIIVKDSLQSVEEISIQNQKSPEEIVELIMK